MRASVHGFDSKTFHHRCDNEGPTLTIIKANNRVFGGFTKMPWDCTDSWKTNDPNAFIFRVKSIDDDNNSKIETFKCTNQNYVIWSGIKNGPTFGDGHDIVLYNDCNKSTESYANFGNSYQAPAGIKYQSEASKTFLADSYNFQVQDYEVFQVLFP